MVLRAGLKKKLRLYVELKIYDKNRRKITGPQCVKVINRFVPPSLQKKLVCQRVKQKEVRVKIKNKD
jgi:hypothetical protein